MLDYGIEYVHTCVVVIITVSLTRALAMADEQTSRKKKGKKKKSVLANAKKYAKKEWWGRGSNIPEDTYHYFVSILEVMKNGFTSDEEKCKRNPI